MLQERKELIEEMVREHPLLLLTLKDVEELTFVNSLLPFSIGIEIECNQKEGIFNESIFRSIPNIMAVECDYSEQRFRIPAGITGFVVLYHISETLKKFSELNPLSGIHYHVGVEDNYDRLINAVNINNNADWILEELDTWNYIGTFNSRNVGGGHSWVRTSQYVFKTLEFRLGEMTFDYELLVKRILHLCRIVCKYIEITKGEYKIPNEGLINTKEILEFEPLLPEASRDVLFNLYKELKDLDKEEEVKDVEEEEMMRVINNRIIKS